MLNQKTVIEVLYRISQTYAQPCAGCGSAMSVKDKNVDLIPFVVYILFVFIFSHSKEYMCK